LHALVGEDSPRRTMLLPPTAFALIAVLALFAPGGLRGTERAALGLLAIATVATSMRVSFAHHGIWLGVAALMLNLTTTSIRWSGGLLPNLKIYETHAPTLRRLGHETMTVQDRLLLMPTLGSELGGTLMRRLSTVLQLRDFSDYEVLPGDRWVKYLVMLRSGVPMRSYVDQIMTVYWFTANFRPRLLDVAAIRYLVMPADGDTVAGHAVYPRVPVADSTLHVYRNDTALPRARVVPHVEVIPDAEELLRRLASGPDDLATVAFLEEPPPSGWTGTASTPRRGNASFVLDDPEHIIIDVDTPERGFLVLADRFYPGWRAMLDGAPVPVLLANYMFRLVEVPAGHSRVEFTFFPNRLVIGATISGATGLGIAALLCRLRARNRSP